MKNLIKRLSVASLLILASCGGGTGTGGGGDAASSNADDSASTPSVAKTHYIYSIENGSLVSYENDGNGNYTSISTIGFSNQLERIQLGAGLIFTSQNIGTGIVLKAYDIGSDGVPVEKSSIALFTGSTGVYTSNDGLAVYSTSASGTVQKGLLNAAKSALTIRTSLAYGTAITKLTPTKSGFYGHVGTEFFRSGLGESTKDVTTVADTTSVLVSYNNTKEFVYHSVGRDITKYEQVNPDGASSVQATGILVDSGAIVTSMAVNDDYLAVINDADILTAYDHSLSLIKAVATCVNGIVTSATKEQVIVNCGADIKIYTATTLALETTFNSGVNQTQTISVTK